MAIGKAVTKFGVTLNSAYHRIEWMNLNLLGGNKSLDVQVATYSENGGELIGHKSYVLPIDNKANVSLAYAYRELAKLEEFTGGAEV